MELATITAELARQEASWRWGNHWSPQAKQIIVSFPNGYGASIVHAPFSYGVELAVLTDGGITYETPITSDVLGHLTPETLRKALLDIAALPSLTEGV